jgi:hypothetical protein
MPLPLLPIVVVCLGAAAYHKTTRNKGPGKGVLTPERQHFFESAIKDCKDPEKLRILAKTYREQGLTMHADMLEKRANLRAIPDDKKKERRAIFKRAMKSTDINAVRNLANAYEREGCTGAAKELRDYAASLPVLAPAEVKPVMPVPPPQPVIVTAHGEDDIPDASTLTEEETVDDSEDESPDQTGFGQVTPEG